MVKVGILRCMMYYLFFPMWNAFFEGLGAQVVVSDETNKKIMDDGIGACVDEACLAVKACFGHAINLKDRVDFLFIPRLTSISKNEFICPKFGGLPDMIRNNISGLPRVIDTEVNIRKDKNGLLSAAFKIGEYFDAPKDRVYAAYENALLCGREFNMFLRSGFYPADIIEKKGFARRGRGSLKIAVIAHCYNIHDDYTSMGLLKKLEREDIDVLTVDMMDEAEVSRKASKIPKKMFWYFGRMAVGTALCILKRRDIDGVLYVMSFGCGVDSFVCDFVERLIRRNGDLPFAVVTLDEHTGEAGLNTRIEAFADMIRWRGSHEADFSAHGQHLHHR